jgi:hypothetical protein
MVQFPTARKVIATATNIARAIERGTRLTDG